MISLVNNKILIRTQIFNKSKVKVSIFRLVRLIDVSLVIIKVDLFYTKSKFFYLLLILLYIVNYRYVALGFSLMMSFVKI